MSWVYLLLMRISSQRSYHSFHSLVVKELYKRSLIFFGICLILGMGSLIKAVQIIPMGTAYAVFTGIGAVGTVLIGIFVFKEPVSIMRMFFISTLIISIVGLKAVSH